MSDKIGYNLGGLEEAIKGMMELTQGIPHIASFAINNIGETIVERAKDYIYGDAEPYGENWEPLWRDPNNPPPGLGRWTPEWNENSRKVRRSDDQPLLDTGGLAEAIKVLNKGKKSGTAAWVEVGVEGEYAEIAAKHEYGGDNPLPNHNDIPERPFLFPAIVDVLNDRQYLDDLEYSVKKMVDEALMKKKKPKSNAKAKKRKRKR